jgi:hypothetical protein
MMNVEPATITCYDKAGTCFAPCAVIQIICQQDEPLTGTGLAHCQENETITSTDEYNDDDCYSGRRSV